MIERPPSGKPGAVLLFCNLCISRSYTECKTNYKTSHERNRPMNKNINTGVELTEKELACVCGGLSKETRAKIKKIMEDAGAPEEIIQKWLDNHPITA